jgi:subtilisin family serine protease
MAAPHVAGTVALLWSAEPALVGRVAETAAILRGTALPRSAAQTCGGVPGSQAPNNVFGWGRLDALAAVAWAWQAGTLAGQLTDAGSGDPLAGAAISFERLGTPSGPPAGRTVPIPSHLARALTRSPCRRMATLPGARPGWW